MPLWLSSLDVDLVSHDHLSHIPSTSDALSYVLDRIFGTVYAAGTKVRSFPHLLATQSE